MPPWTTEARASRRLPGASCRRHLCRSLPGQQLPQVHAWRLRHSHSCRPSSPQRLSLLSSPHHEGDGGLSPASHESSRSVVVRPACRLFLRRGLAAQWSPRLLHRWLSLSAQRQLCYLASYPPPSASSAHCKARNSADWESARSRHCAHHYRSPLFRLPAHSLRTKATDRSNSLRSLFCC